MIELFSIHFLQPLYFIALITIPFLLYAKYFLEKRWRTNNIISWKISHITYQKKIIFFFEYTLLTSILIVFVFLLADPHNSNSQRKITKNGIDIVIALDISKSMDAVDLKPNRIEKAKQTLLTFLEAQETNRVWLIVFAWKPLTSVPLTFDYNILTETLETISTDTLNQRATGLDGTAIWDAMLMWKNLFEKAEEDLVDNKWWKKREEREKAIVLLTDGDANRWVEPKIAAGLLAEENIKVYSIGIGWKKWWTITVNQWPFKQQLTIPPLDEKSLKKVSEITKWYFFRATDNDSLSKIFSKLEELERNDIEVEISETFSDHYMPFIYMLAMLLWLYYLFIIYLPKNY